MNRIKNRAFSLVELMTIIIIIGILAGIAFPAYKKYIANSKISEAYTLIDGIGKSQMSFFHENNEFRDVVPSPVGLDQPMTFEDAQGWEEIGYPIAIGAHLYFIYRARAGKTDDSGAELTDSPINNSWHFTDIGNDTVLSGRYYNPVAPCNTALGTPGGLGATATPQNNWTLISAVADLDGNRDTSCTSISRMILSNSTTGKEPAYTGGFFVLNRGD
jgi:type II secretory pathway pseudopilin PulG